MAQHDQVNPADRAALDAGERAALDRQPPSACPYRDPGDAGDRARRLWARGYAYGRAILRGTKP